MYAKLTTNSPLANAFGIDDKCKNMTKERKEELRKNIKNGTQFIPLSKFADNGLNSKKIKKEAKKTPPKTPAFNLRKENIKLAAITMIQAQLAQYDKIVIKDAEQLRTYVTNKLIEVSQCGAIKEELRALELLGKMSDVGLFTDKTEIKITHTNSAALEDTIKEKIGRLLAHKKEQEEAQAEIEDAEYAVVDDEQFEEFEDEKDSEEE